MADLHTKNAGDDTVTDIGDLDPSMIEAYWATVGETLRRVFNVAAGDADDAVRKLRQRLENDGGADTQLQFYHLDPFQVAADLAARGGGGVVSADEKSRYVDMLSFADNVRPDRAAIERLLPDDLHPRGWSRRPRGMRKRM